MKLFFDTDTDIEGAVLVQINDVKIRPEKVMLFLQEFVNLYKKIEG